MKGKTKILAVLTALASLFCQACLAELKPVAQADFNLPGVIVCKDRTPLADESKGAQGSRTGLYALPEPMLLCPLALALAAARKAL